MSLAGFKSNNHPQQTAKRGAADDVDDRGTAPEHFDPLMERFGFTLDVAAAHHNAKCERYLTREDDGLAASWGKPPLWIGPPCLMCRGSGKDARAITVNLGLTSEVVGHAELDSPCRACNGHGRQAVEAPAAFERVWCNPPYSDLRAWVEKAWDEWGALDGSSRRPALIVMLLPANRVEQKWWQELVEPCRDRPGSSLRVEFLPGRMRFIRPDWTPGPKGDRPPFGCCLLIWSTGGAA